MKLNINVNWEFITVWLGAIFTGALIVAILVGLAQNWADKSRLRKQSDPELAAVELRIPNFAESNVPTAEDINTLMAKSTTGEYDSTAHADDLVDASAAPTAWSYSGGSGPEFWAQLDQRYATCGGKQQSPVDLATSASPVRDLQPVRLIYKDLPAQLINDGPLVRIKPVQGHSAVLFDETFHLNHIEVHVPSEHHLNGVVYDMEIQFYHKNISDQWAVIGVLAKESRRTHTELKKILSAIAKGSEHPVDINSFMPSKFLPASSSYLYYKGSRTSPPCSENVRWVVMTDPIYVSDAQIDALSKANGFTARPLQVLGQRTVDKSWR